VPGLDCGPTAVKGDGERDVMMPAVRAFSLSRTSRFGVCTLRTVRSVSLLLY